MTRVFQNADTGEYIREDGKPGYRCHRCDNGYATARAREIHDCTGFENDLATFTHSQGAWLDGYTEQDIAQIDCNTVQFVAVWEYKDQFGFAGVAELVGRERYEDGTWSLWRYPSPEFLAYMSRHPVEEDAVPLDKVNSFLSEQPYPIHDVERLPVFAGSNAAPVIL